jgi:hypothetical protein
MRKKEPAVALGKKRMRMIPPLEDPDASKELIFTEWRLGLKAIYARMFGEIYGNSLA